MWGVSFYHNINSLSSKNAYTRTTPHNKQKNVNCINLKKKKKKNRILILHIKKFSFITDPKMLCKIKPNLFLSADDFCISVYCLP